MRPLILLLAIVLTGCAPVNLLFDALFAPSAGCPTDKILFTQDEGCLNDGSFEFCVANDPELLNSLYVDVPNMMCIQAGGRARCDIQTQMLCMVSTEGLCEPNQPRALTAEGWELACNLASRPYIGTLVPTWYE
jgi:hypothetical protein